MIYIYIYIYIYTSYIYIYIYIHIYIYIYIYISHIFILPIVLPIVLPIALPIAYCIAWANRLVLSDPSQMNQAGLAQQAPAGGVGTESRKQRVGMIPSGMKRP